MSLSINVNAALSKDGLSETFAHSKTASVSVAGYNVQSPTLGTAVSQISTATVSALGFAFLRSLVSTTQATCTITFGRLDGTTLHEVVKLKPGEPAMFRLAPGSYGAKAAAENYRLLFAVVED